LNTFGRKRGLGNIYIEREKYKNFRNWGHPLAGLHYELPLQLFFVLILSNLDSIIPKDKYHGMSL
jgi:hypothetical protein